MGNDPLTATETVVQVIHMNPFSLKTGAGIFFILLMLVFLALMRCCEFSCFSLDPVLHKALLQNKTGRKALQNFKKPDRMVVAILAARNFVYVGVAVSIMVVAAELVDSSFSPVINFLILILIISFVLIFIPEILAKVWIARCPAFVLRITSYPLAFVEMIFRPFSALFLGATSLAFTRNRKKNQAGISVNDISQALDRKSDQTDTEEKEILEGIVHFGSKNVVEIMCPRVDVVSVDVKTPFSKVIELINTSGYSRIPVFSESFDQVSGILFIKDLLPFTEKGSDFKWQELLRPPFFVPETKKVKDLLEDFQKNKIHMAVVVDEYGGSSGIVTLEDVLEEIVGDIDDEFDEDEILYTRIDEKRFLFDGKTSLEKFYKAVECDESYFDEVKGDADTLAGLILEICGEIPLPHHEIQYRDFHFIIESVTSRRIRQVKVEIM